ncbi:L-lactate MFS transporter [Texcoconibacillus texcoconensis]|uniref:OFA family oxalate/formate antiporter-like MFS transporter n=1 Tax=Texcoconibacillus texcoconensis TaxID=1095777 RepID=A0A840QQI3_9BACI|nr:OFA family MFS transporter [Texcoconibacillus texcoconensis]MBB5173634.1 OFA family oxalate/formate antiporter-like MFS transporter [Texcoconibacillus texcoconensis]
MKTKNRWLIALSAISIHLSIGSAYAYSVFQNPISQQVGWESTQISLAFTIAIFFLGLSAAFFGPFVEKNGPRKSALLAATLFSTGTIGSGVAVAFESLPLFLLFYGAIGGIGLGLGYISPVSTLVKWFPDRRGLATGMAVFGFGAGALIASPVAANLIDIVGIEATFYILGSVYLTLMTLGALYIARPPEGWLPDGMKSAEKEEKSTSQSDLAQLTAKEAIKTRRFWMLWVMMFINISVGIMLISVASPMAQETVGMSAIAAASMVGIMGLFNGGGRIVWSSASDYIGRSRLLIIFFAIQFTAFLILPAVHQAIIFQLLIFIVISIYGGGFAVLPAFIGDLFGTKQLGAIHGLLLTSWSMAGVVGPMTVSFIYETFGVYTPTFYLFAVLLGVAFVTSIFMYKNIQALQKEKESTLVEAEAV